MANRQKKRARRSRRKLLRASSPRQEKELVYLTAEGGEGECIIAQAESDGSSLATFKMKAYTGGLLRVGWRPVVVDLSGMRITAKSRPIFRQHDPQKIVGHTTKIENDGKVLNVEGVVSGVGPDAAEVIALSKNGFQWQASIGAHVDKMISVEEDQSITLNGRTFKGPIYVAKKTTLAEVSFVPLGADDNTSAKVAANVEVQDMGFEKWLTQNGFVLAELTDAQKTYLRAQFEASCEDEDDDDEEEEVTAETSTIDVSSIVNQAVQAAVGAVNRTARIRELCAGNDDLLARATKENWDEMRTELEVLRASRGSGPAIHIHGEAPRDTNVIEAAMLISSGMAEDRVGTHYSEEVMNRAISPQYRGFGLHELMYASAMANGAYIRPGRMDNEAVRTVLRTDPNLDVRAASGWSTVSLTGILSNVANKALLDAYSAIGAIADIICDVTDHADFKTVTRYRMTGVGVFEQVGPTGEIAHGDVSEESYTNAVLTYAKMLALTRTMMINDDLGAFLQIPRLIGRMAALKREETVFTLLLSNPSSFFAAGNNNYFDGASSVLQVSSLTTAEQMFLDQTDSEGKPILIEPKYLLVPSSLKVTATSLMTESKLIGQGAVEAAILSNNPHAGKWTPLATPYLNNSAFTGYSATAWYLLADPAICPIMQIAYLRGNRTPTLESAEADFNVLGVQWRGYFDWGVAMQDKRGGVKSKGAA